MPLADRFYAKVDKEGVEVDMAVVDTLQGNRDALKSNSTATPHS